MLKVPTSIWSSWALALPEEGKEDAYAARIAELADGLPSCFFVHNGSLFIGELVSPGID